jgi:hypothetical protein
MPSLSELQQNLAMIIRGRRAHADNLGIDAASLSAERRLAVYRNHHGISLVAALLANFPVTAAVIGEAAFSALARSFLVDHPPTEPRLAAYGAALPDFIAGDPRFNGLAYLADVARLDCAWRAADLADEVESFQPQHLAGLDGVALEALRLVPHPSLTLLVSPFPLLRIRELALSAGEAHGEVTLEEGGVPLMIWRRDGIAVCRSLDATAFGFVQALKRGEPLGAAADDLKAENLPALLAECVLAGAFRAPT